MHLCTLVQGGSHLSDAGIEQEEDGRVMDKARHLETDITGVTRLCHVTAWVGKNKTYNFKIKVFSMKFEDRRRTLVYI